MLLGEPRFTPDPATLTPGPESAFEIIVHDGVDERATRLPVRIDVPLQPLASWPEDGVVLNPGAAAGIAFNVPIDGETLGSVELRADGVSVPANVSLDPSAMLVSIAPQEPEAGVTYTALADRPLRAKDGRQLDAGLEITFSIEPPASGTSASEPESEASGHDDMSEAADAAEAASESATMGTGEVTLELGEATTLPARILHCATEGNGDLSQLEIDADPEFTPR